MNEELTTTEIIDLLQSNEPDDALIALACNRLLFLTNNEEMSYDDGYADGYDAAKDEEEE